MLQNLQHFIMYEYCNCGYKDEKNCRRKLWFERILRIFFENILSDIWYVWFCWISGVFFCVCVCCICVWGMCADSLQYLHVSSINLLIINVTWKTWLLSYLGQIRWLAQWLKSVMFNIGRRICLNLFYNSLSKEALNLCHILWKLFHDWSRCLCSINTEMHLSSSFARR